MKRALSNLLSFSILTVLFTALPFHATLAASDGEEFNAGEMIVHHVSDAHEIHIIGDFAIYLPVILWTDNGLDVFSSSHLYHNPQTEMVNGEEVHFYAHEPYIMHDEKIYYSAKGADDIAEISNQNHVSDMESDHLTNARPLDFSITKSIAGMFIVLILMVLIFGSAARKYKKNPGKAPSGLQNALEPFILFIRDEVARPAIGRKADKFIPFLLSTFFFIWISNMLGLIPFIGGFNITGTIAVTIVMAFIVLLITSVNGNKHYWGHIFNPPGVAPLVKLILVPIEILQVFLKPAVLMIRLTANITAGHIIILAFVSLALIFGQTSATAGYGVGVGAVAFMIFMFFLELLVAFLQAYVFVLLAALYFGDATHEDESHHTS